MLQKTIFTFLLLVFYTSLAQKSKSTKMGNISKDELKMKLYAKDSTAKALVLFEHANLYLDEKHDHDFRTDYYSRIKLFDKSEFNRATIKIPLYKKQKVVDVKGITYNLNGEKIGEFYMSEKDIYIQQKTENWKEVSFTLPNLKEGCVIEYSYSFISPYSRIKDWYFQSDIPKMYSKHSTSILANWKHNVRLLGTKKLDVKDISVKKGCVYISGLTEGSCIVRNFEMKEIPAFKEEDYMLSKKNFMSRLVYEVLSFTSTNNVTTKYTKTWKDADKSFRKYFLDGQTSKKGYFKKKLPKELFITSNTLDRAKKAYYFIQNRMTWNNKFWSSNKMKVKRIYDQKEGSVDGINLTLYNTLQALDIESYIVALSTRNNGLLTKVHPVLDDFNYVIVKAVIDGKDYFLDATDKFLPFGEIPLRCLNGEGRVLDFKKGSYWQLLKPRFKSSSRTKAILSYSTDNTIIGTISVLKKGYTAISERKKIIGSTTEEYLNGFETEHPNIEVEDVKFKDEDNNEAPLSIDYTVNLENLSEDASTIRINPFFYNKLITNPFRLKNREYPVDFGYPRRSSFLLRFQIPEGYSVVKIPESKTTSLPNKGGRFILKATQKDTAIELYSRFEINKKLYSNVEYHYVKEYFNQVIKAQNQFIIFKKK